MDTTFFQPRERNTDLLTNLGLDASLPVFIFIGRITADKGLGTLSEALAILLGQGERIQLIVIGAQDERDSHEHLSQLTQVLEQVRFFDHLSDVRPYLAASDALVLPTLREGMPNVVLEAAAMGIPAVTTTATGAVDSVVDGQTGLLVEPNAPDELARALKRLIRDAPLRSRLGTAARDRAVREFQPEEVARAIVDHALGHISVAPRR